MVNKVILVGNVGRDPELRYTASGRAVANFSLATNYRSKDVDGNWQDHTEWHRCVAWARLAEIMNQYAPKGKQIYIEGRLQTRQWDDKDGNTRYTTEIVVEEMKLLGGRGETSGGAEMGGGSGDFGGSGGAAPTDPPVTDDDIPF